MGVVHQVWGCTWVVRGPTQGADEDGTRLCPSPRASISRSRTSPWASVPTPTTLRGSPKRRASCLGSIAVGLRVTWHVPHATCPLLSFASSISAGDTKVISNKSATPRRVAVTNTHAALPPLHHGEEVGLPLCGSRGLGLGLLAHAPPRDPAAAALPAECAGVNGQ